MITTLNPGLLAHPSFGTGRKKNRAEPEAIRSNPRCLGTDLQRNLGALSGSRNDTGVPA